MAYFAYRVVGRFSFRVVNLITVLISFVVKRRRKKCGTITGLFSPSSLPLPLSSGKAATNRARPLKTSTR
jgi:hypothetical protein